MCAVLILNVFFSLFKFQITSEKYGSPFPPINKKKKKVIVTLYLAILRILRYKLATASYVVRILRYKLATASYVVRILRYKLATASYVVRILRYKLATASYVVRIVRYKLAILRTYQSFSPL